MIFERSILTHSEKVQIVRREPTERKKSTNRKFFAAEIDAVGRIKNLEGELSLQGCT